MLETSQPGRRALVLACGLLALIATGMARLAAADDVVQALEYERCMALAKDSPDMGFESAMTWRDLGGGDPALHCAAVALYELGHFAEAALRFERLGQSEASDDHSLRAALLGQAGNAWLMAGDNARAHAALTGALVLSPDDPELLVDRSLVLASAENYAQALDDLNRVLALTPDHVDALVFRASAYRYLAQPDRALNDIERALALLPGNGGALLERGNLRRLRGDEAGARADWLAIVRDMPDAPEAEAARGNLERMDIKTED